jgi:single-strand DNA-binding protein
MQRKGLTYMSQDSQITLRAYLTAEPRLYQKTSTAVPVTEIRVGSTPRRLNRETGEWQDLPTSYYRVKCWRRLAINAVSSLHKGDRVVIRGHFYMSNWTDNQQRPRQTLEIEADSLGHDLAYGWSHFLRGTRPAGDRADVNTGEMARQDVASAGPDDNDDEFPPVMDADESEETVSAPGDQDAPGPADDPWGATTGMPVTDSESGDLAFGDSLADSNRTSDASLAETGSRTVDIEAEAVPL